MRTVIGLFDSFDDARSAVDELERNGFERHQIQVENEAKGESAFRLSTDESYSTTGLLSGLARAGLPSTDAELYAEGVRRGGTLVIVTAPDDLANRAFDILARHETVDLDERMATWKRSGWSGFGESTGTASIQQPIVKGTASKVRTETAVRELKEGEKVLPVIEEEMQVGKRQVGKGGIRAYTHVTETPVQENINLRKESVHVERRPVDRPVTDADLSRMRDTTVEVRATSEEAVVNKQARVIEEVVIGKDVQQKTETVRDTVRRTDVEVEKFEGKGVTTNVEFEKFDRDFRTHYKGLNLKGSSYDEYIPGYRYGYTLGLNPKYRTVEWTSFEPEVQLDWEKRNPGTWERFKDTIRYAWDKVRGYR